MEQRRRYTAEERAAAVAAWRLSGKSINAWAKQAGMSQGTLWKWVRGSSTEASKGAAKSGVEFARMDPRVVQAVLGVADANAGDAKLHGEMTLDNGELRVVVRQGTRWSDMHKIVELMRGRR